MFKSRPLLLGLDELLRWYLLPVDPPAALSERESALLALSLVLFDVPPPHLLQLTPQSKWKCPPHDALIHTHTHTHTPSSSIATIPALYTKLNSMDIPVATVVRLLPILQLPSFIDVL